MRHPHPRTEEFHVSTPKYVTRRATTEPIGTWRGGMTTKLRRVLCHALAWASSKWLATSRPAPIAVTPSSRNLSGPGTALFLNIRTKVGAVPLACPLCRNRNSEFECETLGAIPPLGTIQKCYTAL
jgi:hypothetical protein